MNISLLIGGVLLFIYSIDLLTNELLKNSLDKVKNKLKKFTSTLHSSVLTGVISTSIIQSSSALIMITFALINANILTFNQSMGIVLGSNIASTLTSFIFGLNLEKYAWLIMGISLILMTNKNPKISQVSKICFTLGLLFFSIFLISQATISMQNNPKIYTFINNVTNNYFLSLVVATLLTIALQSSSVFIAIVQILGLSGFISINQAIPLIFGANLGTSFDPIFSLFSANKESKKLAHFSISFNFFSLLIFTILIKPFTYILNLTISIFNANIAVNIAMINILFNLLGVILIIPFINKIKRYYSRW